MDLFNTERKKMALQQLEAVQEKYKSTGNKASRSVEKLYAERKNAVKAIEIAEYVLKNEAGFDIESINEISKARTSIRIFTEALHKETIANEALKDSSGMFTGAAIAGTAAGTAIATLGPTAAMAFATTFGTAATGTAISSLSGVAATNAALAWLGGGALAVGGGGMAAGSTILAMAGPIGLAIGGVAAGFSLTKVASNNRKVAEKADLMTSDIKKTIERLERSINSIDALKRKISTEVNSLHNLLQDVITKEKIREIILIVKSLCNSINLKFSI